MIAQCETLQDWDFGICMFRFRTWYAIHNSFDTALQTLLEDATRDVRQRPPDVALLFVNQPLAQRADDAREAVRQALRPRALVGATSSGVIADAYEWEREPALVLMAGWLPGVQVHAFALRPPDWRAVLQDATEFCVRTHLSRQTRAVLLLADPFTTPIEHVLDAFNTFVPGVPVIGGLASITAGGNRLFAGDKTHKAGLVGLTLSGNVDVDVVVSTGCRPISPVFKVTGARDNVILSLNHQPPFDHIQALVDRMGDIEREALARGGLLIGRAVGSYRNRDDLMQTGEFLIRNILGVDASTGAIAIGDEIHRGALVQFFLHDAEAAADDLAMRLTPQQLYEPPAGVWLFSCNGRGTNLYGAPNGDVQIVRGVLGDVPLAGMFCAGEIGPLGGQNFLHGHTACVALLRPAESGEAVNAHAEALEVPSACLP